MLPLVVPVNASAVLVLLPVSAASVVVGVGTPDVGVVAEPELAESPDEVGFGEESALEAAPDPQPASERPITRIAAAFPNTHKRKSRTPGRKCRRRSHSISPNGLHRLTEDPTTIRNNSVRKTRGFACFQSLFGAKPRWSAFDENTVLKVVWGTVAGNCSILDRSSEILRPKSPLRLQL